MTHCKCRLAVGLNLVVALTLSACAHTPEPKIVTKEVLVPVIQKCATDPGNRPTYLDTPAALKGAQDIFEQVKLLLAGRLQRQSREAELEAALAGCK